MTHDISHIIRNWEYDPGKSYRKIMGDDGREKVQVRVDNAAFQGVLQMEMDGRPDGKQPYGFEFAFDYYRQALRRYQGAHGTKNGFKLDAESCSELFDESLRIYNRYIFMLQLQDYPRVIRDTERNMEVFRFVNKYAKREKDRMNLERWWPYIIRINGTARAMLAMQQRQDFDEALKIATQTLERIDSLEPVDFEEFEVELERSRKALAEMVRAIKSNKPMNEIEKLHNQLERAVEEERFEDAARIRDQLKGIGQQQLD